MIGQIFGRLTVIEKAASAYKSSRWVCRCQCGEHKIVDRSSLKRGATKSCGCLRTEALRRSRPRLSAKLRLLENVEIDDNGCWIWQRSVNSSGYGQLQVDGKNVQTHVAAYMEFVGPIPPGEGWHRTCVLHHCDVRRCINPKHLFLGSQKDNMQDAARKGRVGGRRK